MKQRRVYTLYHLTILVNEKRNCLQLGLKNENIIF
jgi:hypothetical protein